MPAAKPEKRAESRRLVENEGLSLTEASKQIGVDERSVRRWQKTDELAGDPWVLGNPQSIAQKAMDAARTEAERQALMEKARRAQEMLWANRRPGEADAAGVAASAARSQLMNILTRVGAAAVEGGMTAEGKPLPDTEGLRANRLASAAQRLAITYGVLVDKADTLSGVRDVVTSSPADNGLMVETGRSTVLSIIDRVAAERRAG